MRQGWLDTVNPIQGLMMLTLQPPHYPGIGFQSSEAVFDALAVPLTSVQLLLAMKRVKLGTPCPSISRKLPPRFISTT